MTSPIEANPETLIRLPMVLARTGVRRSTWYDMIKSGEAPQPVRLSERSRAWVLSEIDAFIDAKIAARKISS